MKSICLSLLLGLSIVSSSAQVAIPAGAASAAPAAIPAGYTQCGNEHSYCIPLAPSHVIYGAAPKFTAPIAVKSPFVCDNTLAGDPFSGTVKACWMKLDQVIQTKIVQGPWFLTDSAGKSISNPGPDLPACAAAAVNPGSYSCASIASVVVSYVDAEATAPTPLAIPLPGVMSMHGGLNIDPRAVLPPAVGISVMRVMMLADVVPNSDIGAFRTECGYAKMAFDDPIVYPGQAGKSHLHTFFGNTGINADTTPESLRTTGNSTCAGGIANRSAYWVPTMVDMTTGVPVLPKGIGVYYKQGYEIGPASDFQPMPVGLRMIGGNPMATSAATSSGIRYVCLGGPNNENDKYGVSIPDCDTGATMLMQVNFPQCWDGKNLDSPDHKSHMAYPIGSITPGDTNGFPRRCPADHPVKLPEVSYNVSYITPANHQVLKWRLASDSYDIKLPGGFSGHGDWFNGWVKDISDAWGTNCVKAKKDCHSDLLGDGRYLWGG